MGLMKFFRKEGAGIKALREAVDANTADQCWLDQMMTTASDIDQAFDNARTAMASEPSDANLARYCTASAERQRAQSLRQCHGLAQPAIVRRKIERTRPALVAALAEYIEAVDVQIATALRHDADLAQAIGESAGESPAVTKLNAERNSAGAAIEQLGRPVEVHGEAAWMGRANGWIRQLLGE